MKCGSCKVNINSEYTYAINNNQCPACGKLIMNKSKLTSFLSLRALLDDNISEKNFDVDKIASLIIANFDIKQIFKDAEPVSSNSKLEDLEVEEEIETDPDAEHKKRQMKESKEILKKMREEALSGALEERYGMEADSGILLPGDDDNVNLHEVTSKAKQENSRDAILSGAGTFSRGGE